MVYRQVRGDLAQALSAGCEVWVEKRAASELFAPVPPALFTAPELIEGSRYFRRDRGLAAAKETLARIRVRVRPCLLLPFYRSPRCRRRSRAEGDQR